MFKKDTLGKREIAKKALVALSVVMFKSEINLRVLYQKDGENYLCVVQKLDDHSKQDPIQVTRLDFAKVLRKCLKENWKLMVFSTKKVITEEVDIDEISKLLD